MGTIRKAYKMSFRKPEGNGPLGRLGMYGRIILKWLLKRKSEKM
jgi:hypothetical protein